MGVVQHRWVQWFLPSSGEHGVFWWWGCFEAMPEGFLVSFHSLRRSESGCNAQGWKLRPRLWPAAGMAARVSLSRLVPGSFSVLAHPARANPAPRPLLTCAAVPLPPRPSAVQEPTSSSNTRETPRKRGQLPAPGLFCPTDKSGSETTRVQPFELVLERLKRKTSSGCWSVT